MDEWNQLDEWTQTEINEVLENILDKDFEACIEDNSGCYMGSSRGTCWISPSKIAYALVDLASRCSDN